MTRTHLIAGIVLMMLCGFAGAGEPAATLLAEGAWSNAAADNDGDAVRGRLVVYERPVEVGGRDGFPRQVRREVSVCLELQDAREAVGGPMRIFCDLGRTDFRPEYKGGLHCEMFDKDKKPVPPARGGFGGGRPASEWVSLPADATIRLRTSPFGVHRENAMAIAPTPEATWVIADNDAKEHFLGGTFTAEQDAGAGADAGDKQPRAERAWHGTLQLPVVRIASPAAPDPVAGLVAKLEASHGLWLNGMYPKIDAPADASAEQVLAQVFEMTTPEEGKVTKYEVIEQREVTIPIVADRKMGPQEQYTAVRVKTNVGEKIVLLQRERTDWWSRIYGVDQQP